MDSCSSRGVIESPLRRSGSELLGKQKPNLATCNGLELDLMDHRRSGVTPASSEIR